MTQRRFEILFWQLAILVVILAVWQWGYDACKATLPKSLVPGILDPYFISKPTAIWSSFLKLGCFADKAGTSACLSANDNNLWIATLVTLKNTWWGFLWGTLAGIAAGLILGRSEFLAKIFEPYVVALNSIPHQTTNLAVRPGNFPGFHRNGNRRHRRARFHLRQFRRGRLRRKEKCASQQKDSGQRIFHRQILPPATAG